MATAATAGQDKTVTGYPLQQNQVVAGYPTGAAYPYAVPPPSSYFSFYQEPRPTRFYQPPPARTSILGRLLTAAAIVFAMVSLIFLITWLVVEPRLPAFRVDSASVTLLNATGTELTARWDMTLFIRNPNHKLAIYYDSLGAEVWYGENSGLATTRLPPFVQKTQSEDRVRVQFAVANEDVGNDVVKGIAAERALGSVKFGVTVLAWVRFKSGILFARQHLLRANCDSVTISFSSKNGTGTLMDSTRWCLV